MAKINQNFLKLSGGYLFPEIARRTRAWQERTGFTPLRLGIGNTTEALTPHIVEAMKHKLDLLSDRNTYTGYGDEQGDTALRVALRDFYEREYGVVLKATDFFVSDGAKSDAANIQDLFSEDTKVAIADPAYPVYVDSNVVGGRTGGVRWRTLLRFHIPREQGGERLHSSSSKGACGPHISLLPE